MADIVPLQFVLEPVDGGLLIDDRRFHTGDRREIRCRLPDGTSHGKIGQRSVRFDDIDEIGREAETIADIGQ